DELGAEEAREEGRVERAAPDRHAVVGGLHDGVLLAVRAQALVEPRARLGERVAARAAALVAVAGAARRAVVAGGDDALVARDDRADVSLDAVAARRHHARDAHEVRVPPGPLEAERLLEHP